MLIFYQINNPFGFRLQVLTVLWGLWFPCQFSFQSFCGAIWFCPVCVTLWPVWNLGDAQSRSLVLKVDVCCWGSDPCMGSWLCPGVHKQFKGHFPKLLPLHNTPGTFQITGDPLFGPPDRKLGFYLIHCAAHFLQIPHLGPSGGRMGQVGFTHPLEPQLLQLKKVPVS